METEPLAEAKQPVAVGAHHVRHGLTSHAVTVEPHPAVEREADPVPALGKLPDVAVYWQTMRPSTVAGPKGGPAPAKR